MKFVFGCCNRFHDYVAPCAGAWIEIFPCRRHPTHRCVAPCAGAWIEIIRSKFVSVAVPCRPLRGGVD